MATFTVTTLQDFVGADGQRSLREAVNSANASPDADTIVFAPALEGQTLTLTQGELVLTQNVTIDGDADNNGSRVTVSGGDNSRILNLAGSATDVVLTDIALSHGWIPDVGGAIHVGGGSLTMTRANIDNSSALEEGGAIYGTDGTTLVILDSNISRNTSDGGAGIALADRTILVIENSIITYNHAGTTDQGGAILLGSGVATIAHSSITHNHAVFGGGGISASNALLDVDTSTIADNGGGYGPGGIALYGSHLTLTNSSVTGNGGFGGGGIGGGYTEILNSIVAGNIEEDIFDQTAIPGDMSTSIAYSNGHNIFGTEVVGATSGDRQGVAGNAIFASADSFGGGQLNAKGVVPLRASITNPALGGADRFAAMPLDQLGQARSQPSGTVSDIGAVESARALSTTASANNDLLTGTSAANTISGLAGSDHIRGMAGNDRLAGGDGSDLLDGGTGNDRLDGGAGIDTALFGGSTAVVVDLSGATDTARRGSETDTLVSIEGAIGSSAADTFRGDAAGNRFMGGDGRDIYTGGAGRDLFDFNTVNDSRVGASLRDLITDLIVGQDRIDLAGIDADATRAGDQAFRWVGSTAFAANRPGEVGWFTSGTNTIIHANTDADSADEFQLQLTGNIGASLTANDFHL